MTTGFELNLGQSGLTVRAGDGVRNAGWNLNLGQGGNRRRVGQRQPNSIVCGLGLVKIQGEDFHARPVIFL